MQKPIDHSQADEIEFLLEEWGQQLPEPPAAKVAQTLQQLRLSSNLPKRKRPNGLRLTVLATMAAAIVVVVVGGLLLLISSNGLLSSPSTISQVAATATSNPTLPAAASPTANLVSTAITSLPAAEPSLLPVATNIPATLTPAPTEVPIIYSPIEQPTNEPSSVPPSASTVTPVSSQPSPNSTTLPKPIPTIDDAPRNPVPPVKSPTPAPAPTFTAVPPKAPATNPTLVFNGTITALDASGLTLNISSERILITSSTKIIANQKAVPFSNLASGQNVSIQVSRTAQGQLIANVITIGLKLPPRVPPAG